MIIHAINNIKQAALEHSLVNHICFGPLEEYDEKTTILYPYINRDIVSCYIQNTSEKHLFRLYVMDRNNLVEAYNKSELILTDILTRLDISEYTINYFNYGFKDVVHGVYADIEFEGIVSGDCTENSYNSVYDIEGFILMENNDLIRDESNNKIKLEYEI